MVGLEIRHYRCDRSAPKRHPDVGALPLAQSRRSRIRSAPVCRCGRPGDQMIGECCLALLDERRGGRVRVLRSGLKLIDLRRRDVLDERTTLGSVWVDRDVSPLSEPS